MERRFISTAAAPVQLEERDGKEARITGYGSVFYDGTPATEYQLWEGCVERVMPGAFDKVISGKSDVRGLFNHDPNNILGRTSAGTMALSVDSRGLKYDINPGDTNISRDVQQHLKRKDVTGSSFSFIIAEENWVKREDGTQIREIRSVRELYDVGPVTFPAYTGAEANARSADLAEARASFEAQQNKPSIAGKLASYRARAVEVTE
jgi:HK97 family phage prohead protease